MPSVDSGALKAVADKINSPWINLAIIVTMAATMVAGTTRGLGLISAAEIKADSAMQAVMKVQGAMDTFIMLQREANALKREEMVAQGMTIHTKTTSVEESSSSHEASSSASRVSTSSSSVITSPAQREKPVVVLTVPKSDTIARSFVRGDTVFIIQRDSI